MWLDAPRRFNVARRSASFERVVELAKSFDRPFSPKDLAIPMGP